jgi:hypothetical protein
MEAEARRPAMLAEASRPAMEADPAIQAKHRLDCARPVEGACGEFVENLARLDISMHALASLVPFLRL